MGLTLTTLRHVTNAAGLSSLLVSLFPKLIVKNPKILRPLLNISWGYLFGSTLWFCFFSEIGIIRRFQNVKGASIPQTAEEAKTALEEIKKMESDFERRNVDFQYFFSTSTLFSGILLISTVRLATQNMQLRICSSAVTACCLLNSLFLYSKVSKLKKKKEALYNELISNPEDGTILMSIKKNKKEFHVYHGFSVLALYLSFIGLTPYIFT